MHQTQLVNLVNQLPFISFYCCLFSVQQLLPCSAANHFLLSHLQFFLLIVSVSDLITLHISLHRHLFFLLIVSISDLITLHISLHRHLFFLLIVSISDLITLHISLHHHLFFLLIVSISDLITLHISLQHHLLSLNFANICHATFTILLILHALEKVSRAAHTYEATKKKSNSLLRG